MERGYGRNGWRRHRRRSLRASRRAVVSVVGTLLALLVFFALFGIFITQYLPLWMNDNESQFTAQAQAAYASLKSNIDLQLALGGPPIYNTPFPMSSQGVPLLAQPTAGILNFIPFQAGVFANVSMDVGPGGGAPLAQNFSLGTLQMSLPNRYYSPQLFSLEDDAVIQSQGDLQQVVAYPSVLTINANGGAIGVTLSLVQLYGNASQAVSSGTQEVASHYMFAQSFSSHGLGGNSTFNATFKLGTHFPCAWSNFLSTALNRSGVALSHFSLTPATCTASKGVAKMVTLRFIGVSAFTLVLGQMSIVVGIGVE